MTTEINKAIVLSANKQLSEMEKELNTLFYENKKLKEKIKQLEVDCHDC